VLDWLRDNLPEGYADAILWVLLALLLFFILLIVIRTLRRFRGGTFVLGGRNRRTRLAVMDATPVDSRRRLVLVRRDDVEHLILIGGPTDVVVEQDIRIVPRIARPADNQISEPANPQQEPPREQIRPQPPQPPVRRNVEPPRPIAQAAPPAPPAAPPHTRLPPASIPMSPPPAPPAARPQPMPAAQPAPVLSPSPRIVTAPAKTDEEGLLDDLEISFDEASRPKTPKASADEEMTRLLGELAQRK